MSDKIIQLDYLQVLNHSQVVKDPQRQGGDVIFLKKPVEKRVFQKCLEQAPQNRAVYIGLHFCAALPGGFTMKTVNYSATQSACLVLLLGPQRYLTIIHRNGGG